LSARAVNEMGNPADSNSKRELAAIMFSDIAGYTPIMGRDEAKAIRALSEHRELLRSLLLKFNGRMLGEIGDGTLSSFHSATDAVNFAHELQAALVDDSELRLRIGIHVGDIVFSANHVVGDGVNFASRIHVLAPPGGICVSEHVFDEIRNKPGMAATYYIERIATEQAKNVAAALKWAAESWVTEADFRGQAGKIFSDAADKAWGDLYHRDEYTVASGPVDSVCNRLIIEQRKASQSVVRSARGRDGRRCGHFRPRAKLSGNTHRNEAVPGDMAREVLVVYRN
jgi:class 3 adenylate cyclase